MNGNDMKVPSLSDGQTYGYVVDIDSFHNNI